MVRNVAYAISKSIQVIVICNTSSNIQQACLHFTYIEHLDFRCNSQSNL